MIRIRRIRLGVVREIGRRIRFLENTFQVRRPLEVRLETIGRHEGVNRRPIDIKTIHHTLLPPVSLRIIGKPNCNRLVCTYKSEPVQLILSSICEVFFSVVNERDFLTEKFQ